MGNLTQALNNCAILQITKGFTPIIIDYDTNDRRLRVVDRSFLIWLGNQDRAVLVDRLGV